MCKPFINPLTAMDTFRRQLFVSSKIMSSITIVMLKTRKSLTPKYATAFKGLLLTRFKF
jgi:hypothetical protein